MLDYRYVVRAAARDLDLGSYVPFKDWMDYPIMAALSCRGCTQSCVICGGSAAAFKQMHGRTRPAFRKPEMLADDVRRSADMSRGPVFVLGDLRQAGPTYARRFFDSVRGFKGPVILELFSPASREFLQQAADALSNFTLEVSLESHDPVVRHAFGKPYGNEPMERTIADALDVGARRLDVFFMTRSAAADAQSPCWARSITARICCAASVRMDGWRRSSHRWRPSSIPAAAASRTRTNMATGCLPARSRSTAGAWWRRAGSTC